MAAWVHIEAAHTANRFSCGRASSGMRECCDALPCFVLARHLVRLRDCFVVGCPVANMHDPVAPRVRLCHMCSEKDSKQAALVPAANGAAADAGDGGDDASKKRKAAEMEASDDVRDQLAAAVKRHRADAAAAMSAESAPAAEPELLESLQLAGRFFDDKGSGMIDQKDLLDVLHRTQRCTSRRWVQGRVDGALRRHRLKCAPLLCQWHRTDSDLPQSHTVTALSLLCRRSVAALSLLCGVGPRCAVYPHDGPPSARANSAGGACSYKDYPAMKAAFHPPPTPPRAAADPASASAATVAGSPTVTVDGALVDARVLTKNVAAARAEARGAVDKAAAAEVWPLSAFSSLCDTRRCCVTARARSAKGHLASCTLGGCVAALLQLTPPFRCCVSQL